MRDGKGGNDRVTVLPENMMLPLREQLAHARALHVRDLHAEHGAVSLPDALAVMYPRAARASPSPVRRMCCATPSPPTCCRPATTSAPCRNWSATAMCRRR